MRNAIIITLACLAIVGCGRGTKSSAVAPSAISNEPWFCQQGEEDEQWECVRSEELAQNPQPTRLPQAAQPKPATPPDVNNSTNDVSEQFSSAASNSVASEPTAAEEPTPLVEPPLEPAQAIDQPAAGDLEDITPGLTPPPVDELPAAPAPTVSGEIPKHVALAYQPDGPVSLLDLPGDFWAVQLVAVSTREALEAFARKHQLQGMSAAQVASDEDIYYILLLGIYERFETAQEAIIDLPPPFDVNEPWIRKLESLQAAMRAADELIAR